MRRILYFLYQLGVHGFAVIGVVFVGVFLAVNLKLTNTPGKIDSGSDVFAQQAALIESEAVSTVGGVASQSASLSTAVTATSSTATPSANEVTALAAQIESLRIKKNQQISQLCQFSVYAKQAPRNIAKIMAVKQTGGSPLLINQMLFAVRTRITDTAALDAAIATCQKDFEQAPLTEASILSATAQSTQPDIFTWAATPEWQNAKTSILKDQSKIIQAAATAKISPRIMVASLMVEQLRLYFSQRELYQKYFAPLKILANAYHISLGVMSIKAETGQQIEAHLQDAQSPYYLGKAYEQMLAYPATVDQEKERFNRLSSDDHAWNYLYGALYLKQFLMQWQRAGFDLSRRPEIVSTLFNVGFAQSEPNPHPKVGGSTVVIDGVPYSFGRLAFEFYYSGELQQEFPLTDKVFWE